MKDDADKILNEAVPILNGAKEALNQLNRQVLILKELLANVY